MKSTFPFVLKPLPYSYDALEPYIDEKTMMVHHDRHLKTYIDTLNELLVPYPELHNLTLEEILTSPSILPPIVRTDILNNAGGVYNHNMFFDILAAPNGSANSSYFQTIIKKEFGSIERFQELFVNAAKKVFGSGYVWLVLTKNNQLAILTSKNQDTPLLLGVVPLFLLDVWEHAYYLKYLNQRGDYAKNFFSVLNWAEVEKRYQVNNPLI